MLFSAYQWINAIHYIKTTAQVAVMRHEEERCQEVAMLDGTHLIVLKSNNLHHKLQRSGKNILFACKCALKKNNGKT